MKGKSVAVLMLTASVVGFLGMSAAGQKAEIRVEAASFVLLNEPKISSDLNVYQKHSLLVNLSAAAIEAGEIQTAERFVNELTLVGSEIVRVNPAKGMFFADYGAHVGNTVLGLIAVGQGDFEKAKAHLIASGKIGTFSQTVTTFGPNMRLAEALLRTGERETVLEYLILCSRFWKADSGKLELWRAAIQQGKIPDFGFSNLVSLRTWRYSRH